MTDCGVIGDSAKTGSKLGNRTGRSGTRCANASWRDTVRTDRPPGGEPVFPRPLLLNLDWDGKNITGVINPGPNAATVKTVTIDYSDPSAWVVKLEAERKDASGKVVPITANGRLENIGGYRRVFRGTWMEGNQKGEFVVTRN